MVNRQCSMVKKKKAGNKFATVIGYVLIHTYVSELAVRSPKHLYISSLIYSPSSTAPNALRVAILAEVKPLMPVMFMRS
jgi:hypothetical protein